MSEEKKVDRRGYMKYAAAGIVVVAGAGAGAYYATRPTAPPTTTAETTAVTQPTAAEKTRVNFSFWTWGVETVEDSISKFNAKHPDIDVYTATYPQESFREGYISRFVGGEQTDLIWSDIGIQYEFYKTGWIVATEDYLPEVKQYLPDVLPGYKPGVIMPDGKMIGLVYYGDYTGLWYNQWHLKDAQIDAPAKTFDELTEQALKIKQKGIVDYPCAAFFGSYGLIETMRTLEYGMTPGGGAGDTYSTQNSWFDRETNEPLFVHEDHGFFKILKWMYNAINKDKIFNRATLQYDEPGMINILASEQCTYGWTPRYDIPGINTVGQTGLSKIWDSHPDDPGVKQALNLGTGYTNCWIRPYNMTKSNAERDEDAIQKTWKFHQFMGGKTDPDTLEPDIQNGTYWFCKRFVVEKGVGSVMSSLYDDPDVVNAYTSWNTDYEVMKEQNNRLILWQMDGATSVWWSEWSGGTGPGFAKSEIEGWVLGQRGSTDQDLLNVLQKIADKWMELKAKYE